MCLQARDPTELPFFSFFLFWSSECNDGVLEGCAFLSPPACDIYACSSFSSVLGGSHCCLLGCRGWLCRLQSMSSYEHIKLGRLHLLKEISSFIRIGGSVGLQSARLAVEALYGHFLPEFLYLLVRTDGDKFSRERKCFRQLKGIFSGQNSPSLSARSESHLLRFSFLICTVVWLILLLALLLLLFLSLFFMSFLKKK